MSARVFLPRLPTAFRPAVFHSWVVLDRYVDVHETHLLVPGRICFQAASGPTVWRPLRAWPSVDSEPFCELGYVLMNSSGVAAKGRGCGRAFVIRRREPLS